MLPKLCHLDNDLVIILWVTTQTQLWLTQNKNSIVFFDLPLSGE